MELTIDELQKKLNQEADSLLKNDIENLFNSRHTENKGFDFWNVQISKKAINDFLPERESLFVMQLIVIIKEAFTKSYEGKYRKVAVENLLKAIKAKESVLASGKDKEFKHEL